MSDEKVEKPNQNEESLEISKDTNTIQQEDKTLSESQNPENLREISTQPEIVLPVIPSSSNCDQSIERGNQMNIEKLKKLTVRQQLDWVSILIKDLRDGKTVKPDEFEDAIVLIDGSMLCIHEISDRIRLLQNELKFSEQDTKTLNRRLENKDETILNLQRKVQEQSSWSNHFQQLQNLIPQFNKAQEEKETFKKEVKSLRTEKHQLNEQLKEIEKERNYLSKQIDDLNSERSTLLAKVGEYGRDKSRTYQAGDRPQNYMLAQEYKTLQEQYLDRLAGSILSNFGDRLPILQEGDRKRKLNRIKSMLSRSILIVGQAIINGKVGALPKPGDEILSMVYVHISQKIEFPADSPYADTFKDEIEQLLSTGLSLASGKVQYPKSEEWQEKDFSLATQEITNEVYKNFEIRDFEIRDIDKAVEQELQNTIKECLQFLQKTALADPPGLLSIETEGEAFNSDRHEIAKGCPEESGQVLETIYPFYLDNGTVRTKAIVWLEPNSIDPSNDSGSQASKTQTSETKPEEEDVKNKTKESDSRVDGENTTISTLKGMLINTLSIKKFSEQHPTHVSSEGIHSTEYEISEGIKKQILEITDVKNLEGLNDFLINTAKSLNDFHTEINRVASSSSNN